MKRFWVAASLSAMFSLTLPREVRACATLVTGDPRIDGQLGNPYSAEVAHEEAIIVWDAEKKIQHFIRRAEFRTDSPGVGFLVPTPNTPQLSEADNAAFGQIEKWMQPKVVYQTQKYFNFMPLILGGSSEEADMETTANAASTTSVSAEIGTRPTVSVIERKRVAGYDAAVLAARDTNSLSRWLKQNRYLSSPELMTWLQPYVKKGWKVTAFKIARDDGRVSSGTVKMSFATNRPFFPYREPKKARQDKNAERLLRVYLVAGKRMDGAIGNKIWPGRTTWTDGVPATDAASFAQQLRLSSTRLSDMRVTTLEDRSTTRIAADDVVFQDAFDQSRIVPPPIIKTKYQKVWIPADVVFLVFAMLSAAFYGLTKRIRPSHS